jgi:hypothetical protein
VRVNPAYAGALATLATWIISAAILQPLEPTLGPLLADILLMLAGALGIVVYAPVRNKVRDWQVRR